MTKTIYVITNPFNGKQYVGQTINLQNRLREHRQESRLLRQNSLLYRDMSQLGFENFEVEVIETVGHEEGLSREQFWIRELGTLHPRGYNLTTGGEEGKTYSSLTRERIGETTAEKWKDPDIAKRMLEGLEKGRQAPRGPLTPRETRKCELCGKRFEVIETSAKRYCTRTCSGKEAMRNATEVYVQRRKETHEEIRVRVEQWALSNPKRVREMKFNEIKPGMEDILKDIEASWGVKDLRVISKAVCGRESRKEMLKRLKEIVK